MRIFRKIKTEKNPGLVRAREVLCEILNFSGMNHLLDEELLDNSRLSASCMFSINENNTTLFNTNFFYSRFY
jgi:hypothetical protein